MFYDKLIKKAKDNLPRINDKLISWRTQQVSNIAEHLLMVCRETCRFYQKYKIECTGYTILTPEERTNQVLSQGEYNIRRNEIVPVRYHFIINGEHTAHTDIDVPYAINDLLTINGVKYFIQIALIERVICRTSESITAKVMRAPIHFNRNTFIQFVTESGIRYNEPIIATKAHHKQKKNKRKVIKTSIVHYLCCRYGFHGMLEKLGIPKDHIQFSNEPETTVDENGEVLFDSILASKPTTKKQTTPLYVKAHRDVLNSIEGRRVIASIVYMTRAFKYNQPKDLYDPDGYAFKIILGFITHGMNSQPVNAYNQACSHLDSLEVYLDFPTQEQLNKLGYPCDNIYDLFILAFKNIDSWFTNHSVSNLFDRRIGGTDLMLSEAIKTIYRRCYERERIRISKPEDYRRLVDIDQRCVTRSYSSSKSNNNPTMQPASQIFNDNTLVAFFGSRRRFRANPSDSSRQLVRDPEHRFDPTFGIIESLLPIPTSSPGEAGSINPFIEIDEDGWFIMPEWGEDFMKFHKYLTK